MDLQSELVPRAFTASATPGVLEQNVSTALSLLGVSKGCRGFSLICDETAWYATLDLIAGLKPTLGYVGGHYTNEPDHDDFSFLTLAQMKECVNKDECIARLSQHYLLSRVDTNHHTWCVNMLPRPMKKAGLQAHSAEKVFVEMGHILESIVNANGSPPINVAYDSGTGHTKINKALLGLLGRSSMQAPFWKKCVPKPVHMAGFRFGILLYENKLPILGSLDVHHACKRFGYHIATAGRF